MARAGQMVSKLSIQATPISVSRHCSDRIAKLLGRFPESEYFAQSPEVQTRGKG